MQLFVRTLTGATMTFTCESEESVSTLRARIAQAAKIPESEIVLIAGTSTLDDDKSLAEAGLEDEMTVSMTLRLCGGKKKKKKKQYSTPKRIPHKHVSKKMRVLDYFSVDNNDKITKLKEESESFAGCYLADHKDRRHCGRSGAFMYYKLTQNGERIAPVQNKPKKAAAPAPVAKGGKKKKK